MQQDVSQSCKNSFDPVLEQVILGLTDRDEIFHNPFQLASHVAKTLMNQIEQASNRAISWNLSSFDRVGGKNTLRVIWEQLRLERRVVGKKRKATDGGSSTGYNDDGRKKLCEDIDASGTCERLYNILLKSLSARWVDI